MKKQDLDELIDTVAADLRKPPAAPRDRMWARIDAARAESRAESHAESRSAVVVQGPWGRFRQSRLWWPTAAAALILLGIGLGRLTTDEATVVVEHGPAQTETPRDDPSLDFLTVDVLDRAEILLSGFSAGVPIGVDGPVASDEPLSRWATGLLFDTRILLDSRIGEDPQLRDLLADLEYTLAQIARLQGPVQEEDRTWITAGLESRATLARLRTVAPSGSARSSL
jgi:hypothetical protein